jgi:hypothetical protein
MRGCPNVFMRTLALQPCALFIEDLAIGKGRDAL